MNSKVEFGKIEIRYNLHVTELHAEPGFEAFGAGILP
jgi:hypothetical protein